MLCKNHGSICVANVPDAFGSRRGQARQNVLDARLPWRAPQIAARTTQTESACLQSAQRFLQRFLESAANRHRLADRFHLRRQRRIGVGEFLERPARHLGDDVIDGRLEARRRLAGDVVAQLVEPIADGQLGGNLGDGKSGRFRGQRAGAADARIHLDGDHVAVVGVDGELDVAAAGLDADLADNGDGGVAHALIFLIGQRLRRRHGDRVAGMHAHRIEVLDRANDDDVIGAVAHHLQLELFPTDDGFLDQHFVDGAEIESAGDELAELLAVVGDAAAGAAEREARPQHARQTDLLQHLQRFRERARHAAFGHGDADVLHGAF
jgi:hypothetical protein